MLVEVGFRADGRVIFRFLGELALQACGGRGGMRALPPELLQRRVDVRGVALTIVNRPLVLDIGDEGDHFFAGED